MALLKKRPSKLALALSGGGFTGYLFEVGALTALDDLCGEESVSSHFDLYVGVSAGAALAALLANGVRPREIFHANLSRERPYYFERKDIFAPAMGEGLKMLLRAAQRAMPLLKWYLSHRREMCLIDALDKAQDALPSGIYTLEPFARYLEATFAAKGLCSSFEGLKKALYIPAIDLETGDTVIFGDEGWCDVSIPKAITASSAAPIYFCPVRINGRDYIDAGIGRITLFEMATQKGAEALVVLNPTVHIQYDPAAVSSRLPGVRSGRLRDKGLLTVGDQASRINLEARFSQALDLFRREYPDRTWLVISPKSTDTLMFERSFLSFRDRVQLLRCGYLAAAEALRTQPQQVWELLGCGRLITQPGMGLDRAELFGRLDHRLEQLAAVERHGGTGSGAMSPLQSLAEARPEEDSSA